MITVRFWSRALEVASPSSARRFVSHFEDYTSAVWQEAEDREHSRIRTLEVWISTFYSPVEDEPGLPGIHPSSAAYRRSRISV